MSFTTWGQAHNQAVKHKSDYFKSFWESKEGHWELIYPDFDEIEGLRCKLTVKCLDCGKTYMVETWNWLIYSNQYGCSNCFWRRAVARKVKTIEGYGYDVLSAEAQDKHRNRIYKIKCQKCGQTFGKSNANLASWFNHGANCPVCRKNDYVSKKLPSNAMRIRRVCAKYGIKYEEISERAHYDSKYVANIAAGRYCNSKGAEYIADVAEGMAKEKEHGNSRIGY